MFENQLHVHIHIHIHIHIHVHVHVDIWDHVNYIIALVALYMLVLMLGVSINIAVVHTYLSHPYYI